MINIYKLKLTGLQQEILRFLFVKAGKAFNARQIARGLEVSQPAISKALPFLVKEGYLKVAKDKESGRLSIELERGNPLVAGLKRAENLKMIYECGLAGFLDETFPGTVIILFGSYASGEDIWRSDVDIAVIGAKERRLDLERFEKALEKEVILQFYPSFREIHRNLRHSILNGITLKGVVEL